MFTKERYMTSRQTIEQDAIGVARRVVENGFWSAHRNLTSASVAEIVRGGTLWYADIDALEASVGRKLTKPEQWLWETTLRSELRRLAPLRTA